MSLALEPKPADRLLPTGLIQQTSFWGRVKTRLGWNAAAFDIRLGDGARRERPDPEEADILLVTRRIGAEAQVAYAPYGPEFLPDDDNRGGYLESLSEELRPHLPRDCVFLRYDLSWESPYAREEGRFDEAGRWLGPPEPRLRELRMNFGTERRVLRKAATDLMPPDTVVIDLRGEEGELLARMRPSTRRNIRLSERRGVTVTRGGGRDLDTWYALYAETARRDGFVLHDKAHFEAVLAESAGAGAVGSRGNSAAGVKLLLARLRGLPVAGLMLALSGARATFLYGASSAESRACRASYALQWSAILLAKASGCVEYDLFGCSPRPDPEHPLFGLWQFKTGFGGELVHRQGCWDYPLDEAAYEAYRSHEASQAGFHEPR